MNSTVQRALRAEDGFEKPRPDAVRVALSAADLRALEEASARIEIHGAWYPEFHERLTGR